MRAPLKIAIVGSGISALGVAHTLGSRAQLTMFEAGSYFGGHTHTVDVTLPARAGASFPARSPQEETRPLMGQRSAKRQSMGAEVTHGVDTGFLVFNERTYPHLIQLLADLKVETARSDMSFSVKTPMDPSGTQVSNMLEWSGTSLNTVFAQRRNLVNWRFLKMLRDVVRFNTLATQLAQARRDAELMQPLDEFLRRHAFSDEFRDWYFLPMIGCIWSCPLDQMLQFPVATMIRFCHNHGLIQLSQRPQWWTVTGGARNYVEKITAGIADKRLNTPVRRIERDATGVRIITDGRTEDFDKVVIATHSDQALALLANVSPPEAQILGAIRYHPNRAVLHTDSSVLPANRQAWAAWNYERSAEVGAVRSRTASQSPQVCLHYLINKLQPVPFSQPVVVSLNPVREIAPQHVLGEFDYTHPVFDLAAIQAQTRVPTLQGKQNTYFCGAWMGYGFHEDGLKAGLGVARSLLADIEKREQGWA
jgi:predicted NAD/FAD-binding protein